MGSQSSSVKASLQSLKLAADSAPSDLVHAWKARARANLSGTEEAPVKSALPFPLSMLRSAYEALQEDADQRLGVAQRSQAARAELARGNAERAISIARAALEDARSLTVRRELWNTLAWSGIQQRDPFLTHLALQNLPPADIELYLVASYLSCCNRQGEAEQLLREARDHGCRSREASKLLIELLFARGDRAGALALAATDERLLSVQDWRALSAVFSDELPAQTAILTAS
jgi:hypothetical protein